MRIYDKSKGVKNVGLNDIDRSTDPNGEHYQAYMTWMNMLRRCYDPSHYTKFPTYFGCSVCKEWLIFSNFEKWFNQNYREGYDLDKDIIKKGNKEYCPEYCAYVPKQINYLFCRSNKKRGDFPIGVTYKKDKRLFKAYMLINRKQIHLGYFDNPDDAFSAYKHAKEAHIKEVAEDAYANGLITRRVYDALISYNVEITD